MTRTDIIQSYIDKYGYKTYVEIGTQNNKNFNNIKVESKIGVDPDVKANATYCMTSDAFFSMIQDDTFDCYFIDGLHHAEQVYKDIINAINHLSDGGTIICHDMNPQKEIEQRVPRETKRWNGDCWKAWVRLRSERKDLEMFVVDADEGCGVIKIGKQKTLNIPNSDLLYEDLDKNRVKWLNLISEDEFKERL